jgi:hypothetical protein
MRLMLKRNLHYILLLLLIADSVYFFCQFYHTPLDGDMAGVIVPKGWYNTLMSDPLGLNVLLHNKYYGGSNRFFAHWFMLKYFKTTPFLLQHFVNPIDSIYLSCAIIKTAIELFIIYLLASAIALPSTGFKKNFLIAAILVAPLIQVQGYNRDMGIIDQSITYALFYALPVSLLLFFLYIFYRSYLTGNNFRFNNVTHVFLFLSPVVLTLSGPLVSPVVLIVCPLVILFFFFTRYKNNQGKLIQRIRLSVNQIPQPLFFYFTWIFLWSIYSFYIGLNNAENFEPNGISLLNRYLLLPQGIANLFQKIGMQLLLTAALLNSIIIRIWYNASDGKKILRLYKWAALFIIIYILLLPLGGYRTYRPYIIRYDTIMPVTIALLFIYGLSTLFLLKNIPGKAKYIYIGAVAIFLLIYKNTDTMPDNSCERQALQQLAHSPDNIVLVSSDCTIMEWNKITDPDNSELDCDLFQYWGITRDRKLYYQK